MDSSRDGKKGDKVETQVRGKDERLDKGGGRKKEVIDSDLATEKGFDLSCYFEVLLRYPKGGIK